MIFVGVQEGIQSLDVDFPVLHQPRRFQRGQTRHIDILLHGDEAGERNVHRFHHVLQLLFRVHAVAADRQPGHPRRVRNAQMLGNGGAHLGGVAVSGLAAAEDQIKVPHAADGLREGVAGSQHVRAAQPPVAEHIALIRAHHVGLPDDGLGLGRAHGAHGHGTAVRFPKAQRRFQGVEVIGVHFALYACALEYARFLVHLHLVRGGHLLDADKDSQCRSLLLGRSHRMKNTLIQKRK